MEALWADAGVGETCLKEGVFSNKSQCARNSGLESASRQQEGLGGPQERD